MVDPQVLIEQYLAGELSQAEHIQLSHWLSADESNRQSFLAEIDFYRTVRGVLIEEQRDLAKQAEIDDSGIFDAQTLSALREIQAAAKDTPPVRLDPVKVAKAPHEPMPKITPGMVLSLVPKRYLYSGIAAAFALAFVFIVLIQFAGSGSGTDKPIAKHTPTPTLDAVAPLISVATLTATHDAQWVQGAFAPGAQLRPGDRLTLTAGFAEITTNRGAVAILEAPVTIELFDNNNAIHLHAGKLVGICETASSLGFTVYTPDGRLIDTGTRFGVIHEGMTRVRVIEGEVVLTAKHSDAATPSTPLSAGQTARIAADQSDVIVEPIEDFRFVAHWDAITNKPQLEGAIQFDPAMPIALSASQTEANTIKVYLERSSFMLANDVVATITEPGDCDKYEDSSKRIAAGQVVDSYFVHLDPQGNENATAGFHGTIQFDRPILGIIATGNHLAQSHETFGLAGVTYGSANAVLSSRGIDPSGVEASGNDPSQNDRIQLSEDRRTLTLDLYCGLAIDQFRVLVASEQETR